MAAIVNARDMLLQAASPRLLPVTIPMDKVEGLEDALGNLGSGINGAQHDINNLLNSSKALVIQASATTFIGTGSTSPAQITLTADKRNGLAGTVAWSVVAGVATLNPNGDSCSVAGSSVTGYSVTVRARVTMGATNYDAFVILQRLGGLSGQDQVNLTSQVVGQLANGNISGLGALALLNTVDLNSQTVGALNGATQVTGLGGLAYLGSVAAGTSQVTGLGALATQNSINLGSQVTGQLWNGSVSGLGTLATLNTVNAMSQVTNLGALAFASALAANQIGAGTMAAGVIYAGAINASQVKAGILSGRRFQTSATGARLEILTMADGAAPDLIVYDSSGTVLARLAPDSGSAAVYGRGTGSRVGLQAESADTALAAAQIRNTSSGPGLLCNNTGAGIAARVQASSGIGISVSSTSGPDMFFTPRSSPPSSKTRGSVFFHSTKGLCQADGSNWYSVQDGTVVT